MRNNHLDSLSDESGHKAAYQGRVAEWLHLCFGDRIALDPMERNHRFLEEALELAQACSCTPEEAHKLVEYVFNRPVGEKAQEVGGVMVTLAALCHAQGVSLHASAEQELSRVNQPEIIERIRVKQSMKPAMSPLPGVYPERTLHESVHGRTGCPEADLALILLGRIDAPADEERIDQLEKIVAGLGQRLMSAASGWFSIAIAEPAIGQPIAVERKGMPPFAGVYDPLDGVHRCVDRVSGTWWEFAAWVPLPGYAPSGDAS